MNPKENNAENNNIKMSTNYMSNTIKKNVQYLQASLSYAKADVKPFISNIIELYKDRKIANITTAENMILQLRTIDSWTKNRTIKRYEKLVAKYEHKEPVHIRMKATREKNIEKKVAVKKNTAAAKIQKLFQSFTKSDKITTYLVDVLLFSSNRGYPKQKSYKGVYQIKEEQYQVKAPNPFPQDIYQQLIKRDQRELFIKGKRILETNKDYLHWRGMHPSATDIYAFKFLSYDTLADTGKKYSPLA